MASAPKPDGDGPHPLGSSSDDPTRALDRLRHLVAVAHALSGDPSYPSPPERGVVMGTSDYREVGLEFLELFVTLGELSPTASVLDVGCGGGRMAAPLTYYLTEGRYVGFDVHAESIEWCRNVIGSRHAGFDFAHVDIRNARYNPTGALNATDVRFPYGDGTFDFVIASSLFTHMLRDEVAHYLREFARVLRRGGVAFVTAYLINADSVLAMAREARAFKFAYAHGDSLVRDPENPATAVAHIEERLRSDARAAGLAVDRVAYGSWTAAIRLSWQDVVLLRRDGAT